MSLPLWPADNIEPTDSSGAPPGFEKWNWGSFGFCLLGLGWIWLWRYGLKLQAIILLVVFGIHCCLLVRSLLGLPFDQYETYALDIPLIYFASYYGRHGDMIAWTRGHYADFDAFRASRREWGWWAFAVFVSMSSFTIGVFAFFMYIDWKH